MYKTIVFLIAALLFSVSCSKQPSFTDNELNKPKPSDIADKISYSIGFDIGSQMSADSTIKINYDYLVMGMQKAMKKDTAFFTMDEIKRSFKEFDSVRQTQRRAKLEKDKQEFNSNAEKNKKESEEFLVQNKTKPGVKTTAPGLQYEIIREGKGPKAKLEDSVSIHEIGSFLDGKEFDNTYTRSLGPNGEPQGKPQVIPVKNDRIKAWEEVLQMMPVGSKWRIWVPPSLAFGEQGIYPNFPPNILLIFEVEVLDIHKKK